MKFATLTLTLVGALLAGMPGTSLAGGPRGLFDSHCGCATQKGVAQKGHVVQKGTCAQKGCAQKGCSSGSCAQKGTIFQKGHVFQKGHIAQKGCGSKGGCGLCSLCIPNVIPAVLHGIDSLLNKIFCCSSCGATKGCGCGAPLVAQKGNAQKGVSQKGSSCGCGKSYGTGRVAPPNPFVDDELQAPPVPDSEARNQRLWDLPRQVSSRARTTTSTRSIVKTSSAKSEPRAFSVQVAQPIAKKRERKSLAAPAPVIKTSNQTSSGLRIPKNPLRGA
ncbi:MAG: hypothetical protein CMJ64_20540 [Planctomycetaceae bacterium]|nr:hypothetical protein [Planctomycetaceae bacterium]